MKISELSMIKRFSKLHIIYFISFLTAFCSLVYELQYSQLLSVLYGNSVLRYSLTIGIYLFSLGLGSLSFRLFAGIENAKTLWISQMALAIIGPIGIVGIVWFDGLLFELFQLKAQSFALFVAHVPIVLTGVLAGIQIPLLSVIGNSIKKRTDMFVEVLGVDYFGSLVGAVLYGLFLYPRVGLIKTAFLIGLINVLLALSCVVFLKNRKIFYFVIVSLLVIFSVLNFKGAEIEKSIMRLYLTVSIEKEFAIKNEHLLTMMKQDGVVNASLNIPREKIEVDTHFNTSYQEVTKYFIDRGDGSSDECLKLSNHTNMCDSWANIYHEALVNVPVSFLKRQDEPYEVLLLGGGSLLPVRNLLNYNVNIDQVDIDSQFVDYAKTDPYFSKYHQNAYLDARWHIFYEDAYTFLKHNQKKYDLVVMTLPGFGSDKLIHLGSVEFFDFLSRSMTDDGLMVTWEYGKINKDDYPQYQNSEVNDKHLKVLFKDMLEGGLKSYTMFYAFGKPMQIGGLKIDDGAVSPYDTFYLFSKRYENVQPDFDASQYMQKNKKYYENMQWHSLEDLDLSEVRASHIFAPNYDIMTAF
ncbi:MAG: hypothetical protein HGA36_00665 [Candidatus Moranbacteria bacterium]|nr:hypothetical protein [Candidatus Moranbacteria bacterium]